MKHILHFILTKTEFNLLQEEEKVKKVVLWIKILNLDFDMLIGVLQT